KKVKRLAKIQNLNLKIVDNRNFKGFLVWLLKRGGVILACLFWFIFSLWFFNTKTFINVVCEQDYDKVLEVKNLVLSDYKNGKTMMEIERNVLVSFDDIKTCTIERNGFYLTAKISVDKSKEFLPIVSPCLGKVLAIEVYSGKQLASANQIVNANQELVSPKVLDNGLVEPAHAVIKISGWASFSEFVSINEEVFIRTGESYKERFLNIFGVDLLKTNSVKYASYETSDKEIIASNSFLPIKVVERTYYELEPSTKKRDINGVSEIVKEKSINEAIKLVPNGATNITTKTIFEISDNGGEATTFVKFELNILDN
nr:sporulation protein YqfD [bacterium]